jgi:DNA-binding NtrC family response regulator
MSILVVDDDALVLANVTAMLEDLGHRVTAVAGGRQALDALEQGMPADLVLTDQLMPEMSGVELIAAVRDRWPGVPVLIMSGHIDLDPGAVKDIRILAKPFRQDALARAIRDVAGSASVIPLRGRRRKASG